ncbi:hypothetical protein H4R18_003808 [Coemansia javaensis]|uniref:F-box domain-containing protein n=1 Tax=Coemansia javaensis TaxID=2761396 RepID=A0A9W8LHT3_9FUNG|nr:hypothetical protein H4R18_003808 [Coemansia javaensis]
MVDAADEGLGDCTPPHTAQCAPPLVPPLAADARDDQAAAPLAGALRAAMTAQGCARLAVALLAALPADVLRQALRTLDGLLRRDFVGALPAEIALRILEFLPPTDIAGAVALVSRRWRAVATQPWLWRRLFRTRGWLLDEDRWALYAAFSAPADIGRALLRQDMARAARAFTPASAGTLAPAVAVQLGSGARLGSDAQLGSGALSPPATPEPRRGAAWRPVDWRAMYAEYHQLLANWRDAQSRVYRWETAHAESIYCLQLDQHNRLLTGSRDHTVRLWHVAEAGSQLAHLATLHGHSGSVLTLQAAGPTLATGSSDATVCVWDLRTAAVAQRLAHPDSVLSLRFNDRWLATACKDCVLRVWRRDRATGAFEDPFALTGHTVAVNAVHLHGDMLVSASGDRTIKAWDLATRSCVLTLDDHVRGVACLDFDGRYIVSGSSDHTIRVWDVRSGACERTIASAHADLVRTVMFDRRMDVIVSGSYDETIRVWSFSTGALLHKFRNVHTSRVFKLAFDRTRIVSCSHDRSVAIIDFGAGLPHARLLR